VATASLVKQARLEGWRILEAMRESSSFDFQIEAAFWVYDDSWESWRLYAVTPQVNAVGSLHLYGELQKLFVVLRPVDTSGAVTEGVMIGGVLYGVEDDESLTLDDITFISPNNPIARDMRRRHASVPFDRSVVRRVSLTSDEPYIYQL